MKWEKSRSGFTIVELLIVVVVIAILAAITIVAYNGIQQRANTSAVQSDVQQAAKKLESMKQLSGTETYPASLAAAGLSSTGAGTITYFQDSTTKTFCVQSVKGAITYSATNVNHTPVVGLCESNGLAAWWTLNNTTNDSTTNANNGTGTGLTTNTGQNGSANGAYSFLTASNSLISVPDSSSIRTPETFSFWIRPTSWSATATAFLSKRTGGGTNGYFIAYLSGSSAIGVDCGSSTTRWVSGYAPTLNVWTHIVVTCSDSTGVSLYANGVLHNNRPTVDRSLMSNSSTLRIGQDTPAYHVNGQMDDIRLYNRVLPASEIADLYSKNAQ